MQGKVIGSSNVNIRNSAGNLAGLNSLKPGDEVYGDVVGAWPRIYFNKIYRVTGNIEILSQLCNAVTRGETGVPVYMELNDIPEPGVITPPPPPVEPPPLVVSESLKVIDVINGVEQPPHFYDLRP